MKKSIMLLLILLICLIPSGFSAAAQEKTVDGSTWRWEQETTILSSAADFQYDMQGDKITFSGTGYKDRPGLKFGFRSSIAFDIEDCGVSIEFPQFAELYEKDNGGNLHYIIAMVNTYTKWWNTDSNDVKSVGFVVRPIAAEKVSVSIAGRFAMGAAGYDNVSDGSAKEYQLDESRTLTFSIKNISQDGTPLYAAYVNGTLLGNLTADLGEGKTMSKYIADFADGKCYWQFGATRENDINNAITLSYSIVRMEGTLDAFTPEPVPENPTDPNEEGGGKILPEASGADIKVIYLILYPLALVTAAFAVVFYCLYRKNNKRMAP